MAKNKELKEWEKTALKAMDLSFEKDGTIKKNLPPENKIKSIELLYKAINEMNADLAWPFIKLADLIDDNQRKTALYVRSLAVEETIYSIKYLFKQILKDKPNILDEYI